MKDRDVITIYGAIMMYLLVIQNLLSVPFLFSLTVEQIQTYWGFGTNTRLYAIILILFFVVNFPVIIGTVVYFVLNKIWPSNKPIFIANIALFSLLLIQFFLTYLFIKY